jgi:hypothetical protein
MDEVVVALLSARFAAGGVVTVTASVLTGPAPHALLALTEIVPPVVPAVVEMEVDVDDPDQPDGSVHVYEVAPLTAETE